MSGTRTHGCEAIPAHRPARHPRSVDPNQLTLLPSGAQQITRSTRRSTSAASLTGVVRAAVRPPAATRSGPPRAPQHTGPGELRAVPEIPHQVREVLLRVQQLPQGRWLFSQPRHPGWGAAARNPGEVTASIRNAFLEAQIAGHAEWRGHVPDVNSVSYRRTSPTARGRKRCDVYGPEMWQLADDGRWVSPRGLKFPEDRNVVQKVIAARQAMGLPGRPDGTTPPPPAPVARPVDLDALDARTTSMTEQGRTA